MRYKNLSAKEKAMNDAQRIYHDIESRVSEITHYQTSDGQIFDSVQAAHIYQACLDSNGAPSLFAAVLQTMSDAEGWN
jgi:ribosomal protein L9